MEILKSWLLKVKIKKLYMKTIIRIINAAVTSKLYYKLKRIYCTQ